MIHRQRQALGPLTPHAYVAGVAALVVLLGLVAGPYLGIDGLRRYLQDLDETWDTFDVTIENVRADDGEHVVAVGRVQARQTDVVVDDPAGFAFRLRDSKVVWAKVYGSHDEALAAVGWK